MIHYTHIIWEEVAFIWKVTGEVVAIFMTGTVFGTPCQILLNPSKTFPRFHGMLQFARCWNRTL